MWAQRTNNSNQTTATALITLQSCEISTMAANGEAAPEAPSIASIEAAAQRIRGIANVYGA